jgi:hypothetical protein
VTVFPGTPSGPADVELLYVEARRVLLDALFALAPFGRAVIVAGAQAIYLRTGEADLSVAPYTKDADLALDRSLLSDEPSLSAAMTGAGFVLSVQPGGHVEPGVWLGNGVVAGVAVEIPVDLIVPSAVAGPGRRGVRLGPHGDQAARRVPGLEAALVDHDRVVVTALASDDHRSIEVEVAGCAALLVAKAHKLHDREERRASRPDRLVDKDASDVIRLMQTTSPVEIGRRLAELAEDAVAGQTTVDAMGYLDELFGRRGRPGIEMAARALQTAMPEAAVEVLCTTYVGTVIATVRGR